MNPITIFESNSITWGNPDWVLPAVIVAVVMVALVLLSYRKLMMATGVKWTAVTLKILAIVLLLLCALQPMRRTTVAQPQANVFPILVDNSRSMKLPSTRAPFLSGIGQQGTTRGQTVRDLLSVDQDWRERLEHMFDVRLYRFDSQLSRFQGPEDLVFERNQSSISGSMNKLLERLAGRPLGGVLLFTDGNDTGGPSETNTDWKSYGVRIYPVLIDKVAPTRDASLVDMSVVATNFATAPVTIRGTVAAQAMEGEDLNVALFDPNDQMLEQLVLNVDADDYMHEVRFQFRPEQPGVQFYRVAVYHSDDEKTILKDDLNASVMEATLANNRRFLGVDRGTGPFRVLYVAGRPNWEFKFLRRALAADPEVQLVGFVRIANKEPKFSFREKGVSGSNPLFAGLGQDEEETREQYDEPVILRLGVKESDELSAGFPKEADELFGYDAVILDDVETEFFTLDQMRLLRRFVSERGGGLLMLGGQESFDSQRFSQSPLGELSPIYPAPRREAAVGSPVRLVLTREGFLEPWVRLRETEEAEVKRSEAMPRLRTTHHVTQTKPGSLILVQAQGDAGERSPAIVSQRFGKGVTAAVLVGDLWRWTMRADAENQEDASQAWRQLVRHLVSQTPRRVEARVVLDAPASSTATLRIKVHDEAFMPLENAHVEVQMPQVDAKPLTMIAMPDPSTLGVYQIPVRASDEKGQKLRVDVTAADGSEVGSTTAGWVSQASSEEFRKIDVNASFLNQLADQTGGEVLSVDELTAFVDDLPNRRMPVMQSIIKPLWHTPWWMLAALACLCSEWGLRRWKGLA